ncbi:uncharacterized protein LOC143549119 [Bidens hawaiensis]|uniref:uncharacterized protein LOC143549119 n=1 Tax=Bidens hawaiensis TaxID=980011 RepID=UPI004049380F
MERITTRVYRRVKGYWQRRRYERLGGNCSGLNRPRRIRIKLSKKLKLRYSLKKLLIRLRDGYVNMMMQMASMVAGTGGYGDGVDKFGMRPVKEYDEKLMIEMYKMPIF